MTNDIIHNGKDPDVMGHFHNIIVIAVYPKIDVTQLAQWVISLEPRKGDDGHINSFARSAAFTTLVKIPLLLINISRSPSSP